MWRALVPATAALAAVSLACHRPAGGHPAIAPVPPAVSETAPTVASPPRPPSWPASLARAMQGRGEPHVPPLALPADGQGRERWLAFVGAPSVAVGAWRVTLEPDGSAQVESVEHWPVGVRVLGGLVEGGTAYALLESVGVLDQPAGLRGTWIDSDTRPTAFDASPLALSDVHDLGELGARVTRPPAVGSPERNAMALLSTLRAASASTVTLARALAAGGAEVDRVWQSTFVQTLGRIDGEGAPPSPLADSALAVVRAALTTQACGADRCEAWTDSGRAVVRFAVEGGRWVIGALLVDAPLPREPGVVAPHRVEASPDATGTASLLRARAREVKQILGEAPLTAGGGTIGVGLTDLTPDVPVLALREGAAARVFPIDAGSVRADAGEARWEVAFADVDGDGRTDVVVHMTGKRPDASPVAWTQVFLAPPASVQATAVEADLVTSLATMGADDAASAAQAATSLRAGGVSRDEACRLLSAASTPTGFRRVAAPGARVLLFDEPGMPTWHPKVVPSAAIDADEVRGLGTHCPELECSPTRPYCFWASGADSLHAWFAGQGAQLTLLGAAVYRGE